VRYAALLVDALGTTVRLHPPARGLRDALAARHGIGVGLADARAAMAAEIAYYRAHHDEAVDAASLADLRSRCAATMWAALPFDARSALARADAPALLHAAIRFEAYPDALDALVRARTAGMRVVVVSNWDVSLHGVLQDVGLRARVDAVVTSAEAGARKPAAAIFERALELAGVPAAAAVHVGDSLEADVAGARGAGIDAVFVARDGAPRPQGVKCVASLAELARGGRA
jgi:putative hydrolase of the HAD superfamily